MDFGYLGMVPDPETGRRRKVWALIVVWRYSRHCFVWPMVSQQLAAVVEGLEAAWAFFEGPPPLPRHRQLPGSGGPTRLTAPAPHARLPGVRTAPWLLHRPGTSAPSPREAPSRAQRLLRTRALLQGCPVSQTPPICARPPHAGAWRWQDSGLTGRPTASRSQSSRKRNARRSSPGTGNPTSRPTGGRRRYTPTTTSPASMPSTRCRPRPAHRACCDRFREPRLSK